MKKKVAKFSVLPVVGASIFFYSFSTNKTKDLNAAVLEEFRTVNEELNFDVPYTPDVTVFDPQLRSYPQLGKSYVAFKEALGFKESGGDYSVVNEFGYMGKYQFGRGTLKLIGIKDTNLFLNSPDLQEAAFYANSSRNKWILRKDIEKFQNQIVNGIRITESGILAAAHLAGPGNVKKFLRSNGANSFSDGFGTSIKYYFKKFEGFDTSFVIPDREAKVNNPSVI
ncbi:peptidoglycan-binding protein LysM [Salinimicrobium tongyeongense]|uniref:Peptidoglycan-binding protein LysM n=1 Tax=Salinimicrobium tongyeongense TaxID=2809707 RepID=A0ABY6NRC0_9FLAO|nr:peptidoglycan-binding protein LysM [Salinimicrobium tongyeongense]UZH55329.1 peptidoglycan-binding protein LysM [Salinimicrobium tongyeongense]